MPFYEIDMATSLFVHLQLYRFSEPPACHGRQLARHAQNHQLPHPQDLDLHNGWLPENMTEHDCIDAI